MFELLATCLVLAGFLVLNTVAGGLATLAWKFPRVAGSRRSGTAQARILFRLRVLPTVGAAMCVFFLLLPAFLEHEPRHGSEVVGVKLAIPAVVSAVGLMLAVWRGIAMWRATRRLENDWLRRSEIVDFDDVPFPVHRIRHALPVIAVVGSWNPRLFIAEKVFESLTDGELAAVVAHESGHLAARDNFKRSVLRMCRDMLMVVPVGRSLDRLWNEASELAADEFAARSGPGVALDLASALVKIARLTPSGTIPTASANVSYLTETSSTIARRVLLLMDYSETDAREEDCRARRIDWAERLGLSVTALGLFAAALHPHFLAEVHRVIEIIMSGLG